MAVATFKSIVRMMEKPDYQLLFVITRDLVLSEIVDTLRSHAGISAESVNYLVAEGMLRIYKRPEVATALDGDTRAHYDVATPLVVVQPLPVLELVYH